MWHRIVAAAAAIASFFGFVWALISGARAHISLGKIKKIKKKYDKIDQQQSQDTRSDDDVLRGGVS